MISKRLRIIADMIDTKNVYDVGCDHALLDIYLYKSKKINCFAIDKSEKCIDKSLQNIKKSNSKVELLMNDGLKNIILESDSTVVLSGLGTKTILKIIDESKPKIIICQSNNDIYFLRKKMIDFGYFIEKEEIVIEDKFYIIIKFKIGNKNYSEEELILGPILRKSKCILYYKYLLSQKQIIENNIKIYSENKKKQYIFILDVINKALSKNS